MRGLYLLVIPNMGLVLGLKATHWTNVRAIIVLIIDLERVVIVFYVRLLKEFLWND